MVVNPDEFKKRVEDDLKKKVDELEDIIDTQLENHLPIKREEYQVVLEGRHRKYIIDEVKKLYERFGWNVRVKLQEDFTDPAATHQNAELYFSPKNAQS